VDLARQLQLDGSRGDVALLSTTIGATFKFSKKILTAVLNNEVEDLLMRKVSRVGTDWPSRLQEFVLRPENARSVPGENKRTLFFYFLVLTICKRIWESEGGHPPPVSLTKTH
jgi:hypothetical protein